MKTTVSILACFTIVLIGSSIALAESLPALPLAGMVDGKFTAGDFKLADQKSAVPVLMDTNDSQTVLLVAGFFCDDVARVTGQKPELKTDAGTIKNDCVIAGSITGSRLIQQLIATKKIDIADVAGQWESCLIQVVENPLPGVRRALVVAGSDRRGTAYGLLEISRQLGVSPWYYFADVPPKKKTAVAIRPGRYVQASPSVKYRGIFLNDEMWGLRPWAMNSAPSEGHGLGPTTYRKIFELLLRLKANYLWPAMHEGVGGTIPFNGYEQNKVVADEYAIVMGSSHIEPMLRNNIHGAEWDREYPGEPWDYLVNRDHIYKYWEDRVKANGRYENVYTMGKRGKDDFAGSDVTVPVLEKIIADQRQILTNHVNPDITKVPQVLVAYTEVLNLYNKGVRLPDDVIFCWPDDNYGYLRQLPNTREQSRSGGSGIYYHFQWLTGAAPAYPWLHTTSPSLVWSELKKAYDYNVRKLWVVNVGDLKPAEVGIEQFMDMAWDMTRWTNCDTKQFLHRWAARDFGEPYAAAIADIMEKHFQLAYARRPEHMVMWDRTKKDQWDWFSLVNYNDEAQQRVDAYERLIQSVDAVYQSLPVALQAAFFETVLYDVKCAALHNLKVINAQKSHAYGAENRASAADYAAKARAAAAAIDRIIGQYNTNLPVVGAKWNGMASLPGPWGGQGHAWDMPPLSDFAGSGPANLNLALEGGDHRQLPDFSVYNQDQRFIDLYNSGTGSIAWHAAVSAPWIKLSATSGRLDHQTRIWAKIDWTLAPKGEAPTGTITFSGAGKTNVVNVTLFNPSNPAPDEVSGFVESHGYVSLLAQHYTRKTARDQAGWQVIPALGRHGGAVTVLPPTVSSRTNLADILAHSPSLEYDTYLFTTGTVTVTADCIPTHHINAEHQTRFAVAFDDAPLQIVSVTKGAASSISNLMTLSSRHPIASPGRHTLKIWMVDPGIILDKLVINAGGVRDSYLGPPESARK